jgi:cyclophilin family peptidyl-prolyl cis-trans isomerase
MMKEITAVLFILAIAVVGCNKPCTPLNSDQVQEAINQMNAMPLDPVESGEYAVLETNMGKIVIEFYPEKAPRHCAYFKRCINSGFYACTTFHRVIKEYMIQGGAISTKDDDPNNEGAGVDVGYTIPAEFNDMQHDKGILSMARSRDPNSASTQFFICLTRARSRHLDGQYTAFGKVVEGLDVIKKIGNVEVTTSSVYNSLVLPVKPVVIKNAYMIKNE